MCTWLNIWSTKHNFFYTSLHKSSQPSKITLKRKLTCSDYLKLQLKQSEVWFRKTASLGIKGRQFLSTEAYQKYQNWHKPGDNREIYNSPWCHRGQLLKTNPHRTGPGMENYRHRTPAHSQHHMYHHWSMARCHRETVHLQCIMYRNSLRLRPFQSHKLSKD